MQEIILGVMFTQLCYIIYKVATLETKIKEMSNHTSTLAEKIKELEEKCKK